MSISRRTLLLAVPAAVLAACATAKRVARAPSPSTSGTGSPSTSASAPSSESTSTPPTATMAGGTARFVRSGPSASQGVAFTFHGNGDIALCGRLLDAAAATATPITVFAVGQWLDANPAFARRVLDAGHELANHTYTHPVLGNLGRTAVASEITRCRDALTREVGTTGRWFRPSGIDTPTALMLEEAGRAGYATVVGYDIDPLDYDDPGADAIVSRVTRQLHGGAIVSLHTGHAGTVDAFPRLVAAASAGGFQLMTVHQLLGGS